MNYPSVNIFVLSWNGKALTADCLQSLGKITYPNTKIIVIDNGSTDGSPGFIKEHYPHIHLIELPQNLGFAGGNNLGFDTVRPRADYSIFLNNDTIVDPGFVEPLINELELNKAVKQTGPKIYYAHNRKLIWFAGGKVNLWTGLIRHFGIRQKDGPTNSVKLKIDYATGCCVCMRSEDFKSIGMFDESFSMYGEDVDLSLRFKEKGGHILFVPESKVWHKVSASLGGGFSFKKLWKKQKGNWRLMRKHSSVFQFTTQIVVSPLKLGVECFMLFNNIMKKDKI